MDHKPKIAVNQHKRYLTFDKKKNVHKYTQRQRMGPTFLNPSQIIDYQRFAGLYLQTALNSDLKPRIAL